MKELLVKAFCETAQRLAELDLEIGPSGNVSFRTDKDTLLISPTGSLFSEVSADKLSFYTMNTGLSKGAKHSSDAGAHASIYKARSDIKAIVHTHAHYITLLAMLGLDIPVHNTMHADYAGQEIACTPFANHRREGYGNTLHFREGSFFLLGKHGGLLLFDHQNPAKIANTMQAFAEIAKLYYNYMLGTQALAVERRPIEDHEITLMNNYYGENYGEKIASRV